MFETDRRILLGELYACIFTRWEPTKYGLLKKTYIVFVVAYYICLMLAFHYFGGLTKLRRQPELASGEAAIYL